MYRMTFAGAIALVLTLQVASAQVQQPYAGLQARPIKALSDEQIADLKAGRGMGLALAAELNGYPGPIHVLELAEQLGLTDAQRAKMQALYEAMKVEAVPLGEKLLAEETNLDRQFAGKSITETKLAAAMQNIGAIQGALRAAHLKYHLATAEALTPAQIRRYTELRGYSSGTQPQHRHGGHR